ncbi:MAG: hypothetical protein KAI63_03570 [Planctomycetes bacterium]|nr:hypothetical protein [Planctomycetota bacterium]
MMVAFLKKMQIKNNRAPLVFIFLLLGLVAVIAQTIAIREFLVVFSGNEICLGIIFAAWLIGITLGAGVGAFITDRLSWLIELLALLLIVMCFVLPAEIYFIRISRSFLDIPIGQHIPFWSLVAMSLFILVPFSFLLGAIFPVSCKTYSEYGIKKNRNHKSAIRNPNSAISVDPAVQIGWVYIFEALGGLIGGVVFTFFLVERFNAWQIVILTDCFLLAMTFLVLSLSSRRFPRAVLKSVSLLLLVGALVILFSRATDWHNRTIKQRWQILNEKITLRESLDSKYENLAIGEYNEQFTLYANAHPVFSFPDDYTYAPLANFLLTEHPDPKNVLLIGGNEGLIKEMLKHPLDRLDYVQLDPKVIELVSKYLDEESRQVIEKNKNKILFTHSVDGRYFVKHTSRKYDLVIVDMPDPSTAMINRFYTLDFFREVKMVLTDNGVVATRSQSAVNYFSEEVGSYLGSLVDTLKQAFRYILVTPGTEAHIFATNAPGTITFDLDILDKRFKTRQIKTDHFVSPFSYESNFQLQPELIKFTARSLEERKSSVLNTDLKPVTYFFNLVLWDTITQGGIGRSRSFLQNLSRLKFRWLLMGLIVCLAVRLVYLRLTPRRAMAHQRFNSLLVMFSIGFAGLALELVLLFSFQNIYGYVYQKIGLIIAFFMFGLAIGGYLANKIIMKKERDWGRVLVLIEIMIIIFALTLPVILKLLISESARPFVYAISEYLFICLVAGSGVLTGLVYPVVNKLYLVSSPISDKVGKAAGLVDSADHFGACLGALLTGVIFIPLFGIELTCWFVAGLNLVSLVLLVFDHSGPKLEPGSAISDA